MRVQFASDSSYRVEDGVGDFSAGKVRLHLCDEVLPERIADALVQRLITHYGVAPSARCNEHERDVTLLVAMESRLLKLFTCTRKRIETPIGNDAHDDVPGRILLGFADCALYARVGHTCHGVEKLTFGTFCAPADAWKYGLDAKRDPKRPTTKTVGAVWIRVSKACASKL